MIENPDSPIPNIVEPVEPIVPESAPPPPVVPEQKSSLNKILIIAAILVVVLLSAGFILVKFMNRPNPLPLSPALNNTQNNTVNNQMVVSPTLGTTITIQPTVQASGSVDQIEQESNLINNDLKSLDTDVASVDQGLSDQQIDIQP